MSVKNGYVTLNANADEKHVQQAGVFYNADINSAYLNFDFDDTINLADATMGYTILKLNGKILQLELQMIDNANRAFVVLPPDYIAKQGVIYGEVYLRYPQNEIMVGVFNAKINDTLAVENEDEIANVYVPMYQQIHDQYAELDKQFKDNGLGSIIETAQKVNKILADYNQYFDRIKGSFTNDKAVLDGADANNLPEGVYQCTNLTNAPDNTTGNTVSTMTFGGTDGRRQSFLLDSSTGRIWYKTFGSELAGEFDSKWMKIEAIVPIWKNDSGNTMEAPISLQGTGGVEPFSHIRVIASTQGNRHVFYGDVNQTNVNQSSVTINITNIYNDLTYMEVNEAVLKFIEEGTSMYLDEQKRVRIKNGGGTTFDNEKGHIRIFEVDGII